MLEDAFRRLEEGDWVEFLSGTKGCVQHFGAWDGKHWRRAARKRADGIWIWSPNDGTDGWIHRALVRRYIPAPLYRTPRPQ